MSGTDANAIYEEWLRTEQHIAQVSQQLAQLRAKNKLLESQLLPIHQSLPLRIKTTKKYETLTFGYLEKTIRKIIPNESQATTILTQLRNNREIETVTKLERLKK